jgi:hypothetical protein
MCIPLLHDFYAYFTIFSKKSLYIFGKNGKLVPGEKIVKEC